METPQNDDAANEQAPEASRASAPPAIDAALLDMLRCPISHGVLTLHGHELWCRESGKAYPIDRNGIPVMLIDEARDLTSEELA